MAKEMNKANAKNIYRIILLIAVCVFLTSCDSGFEEINTDETSLTSVEPVLQLNNAIMGSSLNFGNLLCETTIVRQGISPFTGVLTCANLNQDNKQQAENNWDRYYPNAVRNTVDVIENTEPSSNVHNMARIWRAYVSMVITDTYGDVPYSEAGLGFLEETVFPAYDPQEAIYTGDNGILEELSGAAAALDPSQSAPGDVLYEGDVMQWKRLGYSLLLRAAMRLSEAAPDLAAQYVDVAVSGGLMQSNSDNAVVRHTADYQNSVGTALTGGESPNYYLDQVFVDYLQTHDDPRLASIAVRYPGAESGSQQTEEAADRSPENQIGMPQGYDSNTIVPVAEDAGLASFYAYSQIDRTRLGGSLAPTFFVTYPLTQLLLAEAVVRGWAPGDAAALYTSAIEADMQKMATYGSDAAIPQSEIDAYLQAHPLEEGNELEQINTQYWVASFLNGPETWANFRRTGYPSVPSNPLSGELSSEEEFIRRLTYPDTEYSINSGNLQEAVSRQGPDNISTRIWWDVKQ